jgi:DNA-binding MarR family transcriptional regulator
VIDNSTLKLDASREKRLPDIDQDLAVILSAIARLGRILDWDLQRLTRPVGLDKTDHWTMNALWLAGPEHPLTPTELSSIVLQTTSGMTKTLRRLEAAGFVERSRDQDDGRRLRVRLTAEGSRLIEAYSRRLANRWQKKFGSCSRSQRVQLAKALSSFLEIAEESFSIPLATNDLARPRDASIADEASGVAGPPRRRSS